MSRFLIIGALLVGVAVFAGTKPNSTPSPAHAAVTPFGFTGAPANYVVPAGVTRVLITANGARGGCDSPV